MKLNAAEALKTLASQNTPFLNLIEHGTLAIAMYKPQKMDVQKPHKRDEVYSIISGSGICINGEEKVAFGSGDFLFVPAGAVYGFENFTEDFATWVLFYGPEAGKPSSCFL